MKLKIFLEENVLILISKFTNNYWYTAINELLWVICKRHNSHITSSFNENIFLTTTKIILLAVTNP